MNHVSFEIFCVLEHLSNNIYIRMFDAISSMYIYIYIYIYTISTIYATILLYYICYYTTSTIYANSILDYMLLYLLQKSFSGK